MPTPQNTRIASSTRTMISPCKGGPLRRASIRDPHVPRNAPCYDAGVMETHAALGAGCRPVMVGLAGTILPMMPGCRWCSPGCCWRPGSMGFPASASADADVGCAHAAPFLVEYAAALGAKRAGASRGRLRRCDRHVRGLFFRLPGCWWVPSPARRSATGCAWRRLACGRRGRGGLDRLAIGSSRNWRFTMIGICHDLSPQQSLITQDCSPWRVRPRTQTSAPAGAGSSTSSAAGASPFKAYVNRPHPPSSC
jgi:hypothetical protein